MATGDIKNNLRKLRRQLREMKYCPQSDDPQQIFDEGITEGRLTSFLPLWHFAFLKYSLPVAEFISSKNFELFGKSDLRFVEIAFRVLRDLFSYKPKLTKDQMMTNGFTERKIIITYDILNLIKAKHQELERKSRKPKTNLHCNKFLSKSFTPGATLEASSIPVTLPQIPVPENLVQRHHPLTVGEEILVNESAREESEAVLEDISIPVGVKRKDDEELRPMDDGYKSANVSPVLDRGAVPSNIQENRLRVVEERMAMFERRLTKLEETVDELSNKQSNHDDHKNGTTDGDLTTILSRLTLVESRVQLLQSQSQNFGLRTLPAAKVMPSTKPASHKTLPQGHLVAGSPVLQGAAAAASLPDTPPIDSSSPVIPTSTKSNTFYNFAATAAVACAVAVPYRETQVLAESTTAATPDSTVTSEGESSSVFPTISVSASKSLENVPESTTSSDHAHDSSEDQAASLADEAASSLADKAPGTLTDDAASPLTSSSDDKKNNKPEDMMSKFDRLTQLISDTEQMLGMDTSLVRSPSSEDDEVYTEANSEM
ncbi:uncharacterized protein LOC100366350 [Saccoglossus kowalevskii]|uniref:Centrosomal protein of 44 kDa n=1 Tax=Saccoglossus kowalevskii TaxID=10224 RepID=A0ABM0GN20_SACKO|nr:PREDICTED: centrosomal protein of 44 kDa-like [Saccoglossus kowalevskii]